MAVKSVDITSIEGRKLGKWNMGAEAKPVFDSAITLVNSMGDREVSVEFRHSAGWAGMATVRIDGQVLLEGNGATLAKQWGESGKLPEPEGAQAQGALSAICSIEESMLFKDLMMSAMGVPLPEGSPLKSFEITAIEGKRFTKPGEKLMQVRIDHNSTVTQITELSDKEANIEFRFTANYVGVGVIKTDGKMTYECEAPSLVKQWAERHDMPEKVANEVHTGILHFCIPEAVLIARELKLPPPIPLPQVNMQKKPAPAKPAGGQEVA